MASRHLNVFLLVTTLPKKASVPIRFEEQFYRDLKASMAHRDEKLQGLVVSLLSEWLSTTPVPTTHVPLTEQSHPEIMNQDRETLVISSLRQNLMAAKAAIETALGKLDEQTEHDAALANGRRVLQGAARLKESGEGVRGVADATPVGGRRAK